MVQPKKASSKKRKPGSIDFKKVKRKIGRKLPPPKNATNTQIKSKAIILPEQSVVSERAGLAVSSKGLTLKELLQQTSHHNAKTRKFALVGIRDLLQKNPSELNIHKVMIVEKLRERICDSDKVVRDTLFHLLKSTVFPAFKEDASIVSLTMAYIFNAMTHLTLDIRFTAFNFFELIVSCYPSSFFNHAEQVIDNYKDILQNSQLYMQDRSKVKSAFGGLVRCLHLLSSDKCQARPLHERVNEITPRKALHAFEHETPKEQNSIYVIARKLEELVPVLVNCFEEIASVGHALPTIDAVSFGCILSILQCLKLSVCYLLSEVDGSDSHSGWPTSSNSVKLDARSSIYTLRKLWQSFPIKSIHQLTEKEDERNFVLNVRVTEIYLFIIGRHHETEVPKEKFLEFLEDALYGQICNDKQTNCVFLDKYLVPMLPLIPGVLSHLDGSWRIRLIKAFTYAFQDCKVESKLNLACLCLIENILFLKNPQVVLSLDSFGQDALDYQASWLRKLPVSLLRAEDKNPSLSKVILKLMLKIGQCSLENSSLDFEYNNMQFLLRDFFCIICDDGNIKYGPFLKLPKDCQELAISCLYYFPCLNLQILQSLVYCCLGGHHEMESFTASRTIDVLQSAYKAGHVQIIDFISFLVTIVARFKVSHDNSGSINEGNLKISNLGTYKSITRAVFSSLFEMGDSALVLKLLLKGILHEMHESPSIDNLRGMFTMIAALDSRTSKFSQDDIVTLSHFIMLYMIDITSELPCIDENIHPHAIHEFEYYIKPCLFLFSGCKSLLNNILQLFTSITKSKLSFATGSGTELGLLARVNMVASVLVTMFKNVKVHENMLSSKAVKDILKNILNLMSVDGNDLTVEERHRMKCAFDILKVEVCKAKCVEATDMEGMLKDC